MINRRNLLFGGAGAAGLLSFGGVSALSRLSMLSPAARAASPGLVDRHFVFCYFQGGWDILLGLDPRDPVQFPDELRADTLIEPGYDRLTGPPVGPIDAGGITFGPFIGDLANHADKLCVVRGMSMDTLTHDAGLRRFLTGKPPSGLLARGSSTSTVLAALLGAEHPIPNLSAQVEAYNAGEPSYASALKVDSVDDLLQALRPGAVDVAENERALIEAMLTEFRACTVVADSPELTAASEAHVAARDLVAQGLDSLFDFDADTPEMQDLRDRFGFDTGELDSAPAQAAMAARALTAGVSRCVSIEVASGLDTHYSDWTTDHGPNQQAGFDTVARLVEELEATEYDGTGDSWMDHTVIVGFSEFSRTALLNDADGRDHSLTNAAFLLGSGIQPGVVGASSDVGLAPVATDLSTGAAGTGEIVRPEHILRALLHGVGVTDDVADLRVDPLTAILS